MNPKDRCYTFQSIFMVDRYFQTIMVNIAGQFINLSKYLIEILIQDTYKKLKVHKIFFAIHSHDST
jgi:hypothetical protein